MLISCIAIFAGNSFAQVDIEHRRTLSLQTSESVSQGEEALGAFGFFWFNENNCPWTNTALRVIFAGVYADAELSHFLPANPKIAVGAGLGGGVFVDNITPYVNGERLSHQSFYGDNANARLFINDELTQIPVGDMGALPVNVRGTYAVSGSFYRDAGSTQNFVLPPNLLTQTIQAELRIGGIEPGLLSKRGAELYIVADANYRSGLDAFGIRATGAGGGPVPAVVLGHQSEYERVFASLGAKLPAGPAIVSARICGGYGDHLDELSAWKLGGNLINIEPFAYTLHGYYSREVFTDRFVMSNLALSLPIGDEKNHLAAHLYGDWANARGVPPLSREYHNYFGIGAGVSFRVFWKTDVLVSYGYGINAVRNGDRGGNEVGLALEKKF